MSSARAIRDREMEVQLHAECVDGYLEWYLTVSHPLIIAPGQHGDDVGPSHVGSSHAGSSQAGVGLLLMTCFRLHMVRSMTANDRSHYG